MALLRNAILAALALLLVGVRAEYGSEQAKEDEEGGLVLTAPPTPPGFDPFTVLGVSTRTTLPQLKRAARVAKKTLRDMKLEKDELEETEALVSLAFEILSDEEQKAKWVREHPYAGSEKSPADEEEL
jgi:hypothetical protein